MGVQVGQPPERKSQARRELEKEIEKFTEPVGEVDKRALREAMVQAFSLEDLELLCADVETALGRAGIELQVNLEIVGGSGKPAKVLRLIQYLDRRGYLSYLVNAVRSARQGII